MIPRSFFFLILVLISSSSPAPLDSQAAASHSSIFSSIIHSSNLSPIPAQLFSQRFVFRNDSCSLDFALSHSMVLSYSCIPSMTLVWKKKRRGSTK